jgi:hypothetical protein
MNSPGIYIEISPGTLKALNGEAGLELPLERLPNGSLTSSCKEAVTAALRNFLPSKSWQSRPCAYCAIGARGVSLRRLTLPATGKEDFQRLLRMQIESEFPLAPDELAWGYRSLGEVRQNGTTKQDLLIVAVKKEVIEEYAGILSQCGVVPAFTLAAMARSAVCPQPVGSCALLEIGEQTSELILFENNVPIQVRILPVTTDAVASANLLEGLAKALNGSWSGKKLFVGGSDENVKTLSRCLGERAGNGLECEPLKLASGKGRSTATLGLKKALEANGASLLLLQSKQSHGKTSQASPAPLKWAALTGALLLGLVLLPYAEAILMKPLLAKKLAAVKANEGRLSIIDRELTFLQFLKQNQPPYLDALYLFSKSAPSGAKIESLTMNRRGEVSLRGSMRNADQVAEFRTKLIDSKFFSSVAVEEQTPTPDRQKVNVRITAQWKPANVLQSLAIGPTPEEIEKAKNKKDSSPAGMPAGFPGGMPPGMMPAGMMPPGTRSGAMPAGFSTDTLPPGALPAGMPPGVEVRSNGAKPPVLKTEAKE